MEVLDFITVLIITAALFTLINIKWLKLPSTIGLMLLALGLSLFIIIGKWMFTAMDVLVIDVMTEYDFSKVLFQVMLSFLLFAGALELDLGKLGEEKWPIFILATVGVLISTGVAGVMIYLLLPLVGLPLDFIYCLLFGALISPTDPIAVMAMIKKSMVSKNLECQIAGESLFNDGIGVVVFLSVLSIATNGMPEAGVFTVVKLFGLEVVGGLLLGGILGYIGLYLLRIIDNEHTELEVLVTLSMVLGGASLAEMLHVSGPLAMVVMGLFVGRKGRTQELEDAAGEYVYKFWHLMDEAMNAILFILIGLQVIVIKYDGHYIFAALISIFTVLIARLIGVAIPISIMRVKRHFPSYTIRILTWSGLRGGISIALALSLYEATSFDAHIVDIIITMTYCVVLFSIIVQGLTVKHLFIRFKRYNRIVE